MKRISTMVRTVATVTLLGVATLVLPLSAHAGGVHVSVGIGLPFPVAVVPAPVVLAPQPVIVQPAPVVVAQPPGVYGFSPVFVRGYHRHHHKYWKHHKHHHKHWKHHKHHRW